MAFFVQKHLYSITPSSRAEKHPKSCAEGVTEAFRAEKGIISCAELDTTRLPGRKTPQILRRRCYKGIPGRKRYLFQRGTEYQPPAGQEKTQNPARNVPRRHSRQKNPSFPAQNRLPTASRAEKHSKSCAEGAMKVNKNKKNLNTKY